MIIFPEREFSWQKLTDRLDDWSPSSTKASSSVSFMIFMADAKAGRKCRLPLLVLACMAPEKFGGRNIMILPGTISDKQ